MPLLIQCDEFGACLCVFTRADDACVEYREILLAGGEGCDGEGAIGLGATAHSPLRWRTGTLNSWAKERKTYFEFRDRYDGKYKAKQNALQLCQRVLINTEMHIHRHASCIHI